MDAPTSSPFRTTPDQINNLIGKPFCPISRASLHEKQEHLFFQGILEKRAGNFTFKSSWHERYFILATVLLRTSPAANAETIKTTGLFYFEIIDNDPWSPGSMKAPLGGYFDLSFFCNVKTRTGKEAEYRYMTAIRCPHQDEDDVKELRVRALKTDRNACRVMNGFRDVCIEHIRQCNQASIQYQRAFDGELFMNEQSQDFVPTYLVDYAKRYLDIEHDPNWQPPAGNTGTLRGYLERQLDVVLDSKEGPESDECIYAAKTVTGHIAMAARLLFKRENEEHEEWEKACRHLQAFQEYQVRQLVELALFCEDGGGGRDRRVNQFVEWARQSEGVAEMQALIDEKLPRFAASERYMQLDDFWAAKLRQERGERFGTLQSLYGLLLPSLQMVCAMQFCTTPVQKVRLWAEAIVEAISLINVQFPEQSANGIGGPDIPSLVLFLTCTNECKQLFVEAKLARLFCLDNYGQDERDFKLLTGGLYSDIAEQYAFQAEKRSIDHAHYLLWVEDTLRIVAETTLTPKSGPDAPPEALSMSLELEELSLDDESTLSGLKSSPSCLLDELPLASGDSLLGDDLLGDDLLFGGADTPAPVAGLEIMTEVEATPEIQMKVSPQLDGEIPCPSPMMNFDALDAALDSPCDTDDEEFLPNVDADQILMAHVLERTNNNAYRE